MSDDFLKLIEAILESGFELHITIKKTERQGKPGNLATNKVTCPRCGWSHSYSRASNARRGFEAHSKSCPGKKGVTSEVPEWFQNMVNEKE